MPKAIQTMRAFCTMGQFRRAPADQLKTRRPYNLVIYHPGAGKRETASSFSYCPKTLA